ELALANARGGVAAATGRAAAAEAARAASMTRTGAAMAGMGLAGRGLLNLLGGPWMVGLAAAGGAVWALHRAVEAEGRAVDEATQRTHSWREESARLDSELRELGVTVRGLSDDGR